MFDKQMHETFRKLDKLSKCFMLVVKTSISFDIDFLETPRFAPVSFADASDFIKQAVNVQRTI